MTNKVALKWKMNNRNKLNQYLLETFKNQPTQTTALRTKNPNTPSFSHQEENMSRQSKACISSKLNGRRVKSLSVIVAKVSDTDSPPVVGRPMFKMCRKSHDSPIHNISYKK